MVDLHLRTHETGAASAGWGLWRRALALARRWLLPLLLRHGLRRARAALGVAIRSAARGGRAVP